MSILTFPCSNQRRGVTAIGTHEGDTYSVIISPPTAPIQGFDFAYETLERSPKTSIPQHTWDATNWVGVAQ